MAIHEPWCQERFFPHEDAAKRLSDEYNTHRVAAPYESIGKWIAVRLSDGNCDHVLYDSKRDAIRHQHHNEQYYHFQPIRPSTMDVCSAAVMIKTARSLYDKGFRLPDPDDIKGGKDLITRASAEDQIALSNGRVQNVILPWEGSN